MAKLQEWQLEELFDDLLDQVYEPTNIGGMEYLASTVLKECDPIAYRVGFHDWLDNEDNCEDCDLNPIECTCEAE